MRGLSTTGSISLGCALVAGRKRVPRPATGKIALLINILTILQLRIGFSHAVLPVRPLAQGGRTPRERRCASEKLRMDLLIVEPIETEVLRWLQTRHRVTYAPELARDPRTFRQKLFNVRAALLPPQLRVDTQTL